MSLPGWVLSDWSWLQVVRSRAALPGVWPLSVIGMRAQIFWTFLLRSSKILIKHDQNMVTRSVTSVKFSNLHKSGMYNLIFDNKGNRRSFDVS